MTPEDFYLDETKVGEGVRLPLRDRNNKLTEHWLRVRYIHSDQVQALLTEAGRAHYEAAGIEGAKPLTSAEAVKRFRHLLVASWSFDEPFSHEAVKRLLDRNPSLGNRVVEVSERAGLFFPDTEPSSSDGASAK